MRVVLSSYGSRGDVEPMVGLAAIAETLRHSLETAQGRERRVCYVSRVPPERDSTSAATTGNLFRCDSADGIYIFNWSTKGLSVGTYQLQISLGDGLTHTALVGLR